MAENRFAKYVTQAAPAGDPVIARDPYKQAAETRANDDQQIERARLAMERERLNLARAEAAEKAALAGAKATKYENAKRNSLERLGSVFNQLTDVAKAARDGWATTGRSGALVRGLPDFMGAGTDAYDLKRNIDMVDANNAFAALQEMRDNSPTGGALGAITDRELDLLKSTISSLDPNQSKQQLMENIVKAKKAYVGMMRRIDPKAAGKYMRPPGTKPGAKAAPKRMKYNPVTGELE